VAAVLDYPEKVTRPGLNLLCTPGNDVESTTAEVASGANIVLFTTGLGTPTGNPVAPVVKIASNTALFERMRDIIDINTGSVIEGKETNQQAGARILDYVIGVRGAFSSNIRGKKWRATVDGSTTDIKFSCNKVPARFFANKALV